jgi:hypothetical protein
MQVVKIEGVIPLYGYSLVTSASGAQHALE